MSPCHWAALLRLRRNLDILIFLRQQFGMLESVCQWPLITSSCLPVTMGSTNSLIFKENNFRKCFFVAFGFICTGLCHFTDRLNDFIECMYVYVNKQLAVSPQSDVTDFPKSCIFKKACKACKTKSDDNHRRQGHQKSDNYHEKNAKDRLHDSCYG